MRVAIQHRSRYVYPSPALLGPQTIRLRPAEHALARIESYALAVTPEHRMHWQRDPHGNHVARVTFKAGQTVEALEVVVELAVDVQPVNPFDFFIDDRARSLPFSYPDGLDAELGPYLDTGDPAYRLGRAGMELLRELPATGDTVGCLVEVVGTVRQRVAYVIRNEPGIWTPEETLGHGRGSCRDSAALLVALMRARGIAARFVSGYLVQLADEGMIPDEPRGVAADVVDLHAWAEAYLPGAGWIGFDGTSGLLCGEGHIPLASTASPAHASPLDGTSSVAARDVEFATAIHRLGHEVRPTTPYTDETWTSLLDAGDRADAALGGLAVWIGGEPTFVARDNQHREEWQGGALGADKWRRGRTLATELRDRLTPGGVLLHRQGKAYPGESRPRWALDVIGRRDGRPLWPDRAADEPTGDLAEVARLVGVAIAQRLGVNPELHAAYEDPWEILRAEAGLPVGIDPRTAGLDDPEERRRLAAILDRGAGSVVGYALPLAYESESAASRVPGARSRTGWITDRWQLRREQLFLIPGDSPMGLRLPLGSLPPAAPILWSEAPDWPDPRRDAPDDSQAAHAARAAGSQPRHEQQIFGGLRSALTIEARLVTDPAERRADRERAAAGASAGGAASGGQARREGVEEQPVRVAKRSPSEQHLFGVEQPGTQPHFEPIEGDAATRSPTEPVLEAAEPMEGRAANRSPSDLRFSGAATGGDEQRMRELAANRSPSEQRSLASSGDEQPAKGWAAHRSPTEPVLEAAREPIEGHAANRSPSELHQGGAATAARATVGATAERVARPERERELWVFLPPVPTFAAFCELVEAIDHVREVTGVEIHLEGYAPPPSPELLRFAVTPDPGVLEVNLPPVASCRAASELHQQVFDAALASGLTAERYLLDGRAAGAGGGNHITIGGPRAEQSPWLNRPDLLASLVTFCQHHPSLSYMFTGLFVGPTSQAPRVDEARHDSLYELELALPRLHEQPPAWQVDALLRHLLVDVAGSTHRAEISIDKLFDPGTPHGRQGLVELRAFEMPPHPRMVAAQATLVRALVASFVAEPYKHALVRWGSELHDRFLLPYWLWRDFEDVLAHLAARGVALPGDAYRPFVELRCPLVGSITAGTGALEIRNAIEPWHVLGEEATQAGTARYVDSSMERIELRASGLDPERYLVIVNGNVVPLREAGRDVRIGGVRFRAWCPPHALHPHFGIHHPLHIDIVDSWAKRGIAGGAYHVWHPEGQGFDAAPLTRVEAAARRAQRFTLEGPTPWPVRARVIAPHPEQPYTLDLRRADLGSPMPRAEDWVQE